MREMAKVVKKPKNTSKKRNFKKNSKEFVNKKNKVVIPSVFSEEKVAEAASIVDQKSQVKFDRKLEKQSEKKVEKKEEKKVEKKEEKKEVKVVEIKEVKKDKKFNKNTNFIFNKEVSKTSVRIYYFTAFISLVWIVFAGVWLRNSTSLGYRPLMQMTPMELGSFLSAVLVPMLFVWILSFYLERNLSAASEKKNVYSFLSSVFHSDKKGMEFIDMIEAGIKVQVESLQGELKEVDRFSREVKATYEGVVESNEKFLNQLKKQSELVAKLDAKINSTSEDNIARLSVDLKEIKDSFDKISDNAGKVDNVISSQVSNLNQAVNKALDDSRRVAEEIETSTDIMLTKTSGSVKKVEKITGDIKKSVGVLDDVFQKHDTTINNVMAYFETQGDALDKSLEKQSYIFDEKTQELSAKVGAGVEQVDKYLTNIEKVSDRIGGEGDKVTGVLDKLTSTIDAKSENFVNFISNISSQVKEANSNLNNTMSELYEMANKVRKNSDEVNSVMTGNVDELVARTEEASKQVKNIRESIEQQANDLANVANQVSSHARLSEFSMEEQANKLTETQENFVSGLSDIEDKMTSVRGMIGEILDKFEDNSGAINEKVAIVSQNISHNLKGVEDVISSFNVVNDSIEVSLSKINRVGGGLQLSGIGSSVDGGKKSKKKDSVEKVKSDINEAFVENRNAFTNISTVVEKLNSVAVDLSRLYDPNIQEGIWNSYYGGQKNIFAKYLSKKLDKRQIVAVKDLIQRNKEFEGYVKDFLAHFEKMIIDANKAEGRDVLISMLNTSEYGRIYLFFKGLI
ncbi:MAG: hypothetical protein N4A44_04015 [Alphaproteobacteria bacterium]|jgi:methyl-accepting chemotaxis protein|nr:hypothetical protein [Alphaproteobacteria bacterium]